MYFKRKYLEYILKQKKTLEGRIGYDNIRNLKKGDIVYLNGEYKAQIVGVRKFSMFREAVTQENYKRLIPDAKSPEDALRVYEMLYPLWKQRKYGVYIFEIKYPV